MQHLAQFALSVLSLITGEFKINGFLSLRGISVLLPFLFKQQNEKGRDFGSQDTSSHSRFDLVIFCRVS